MSRVCLSSDVMQTPMPTPTAVKQYVNPLPYEGSGRHNDKPIPMENFYLNTTFFHLAIEKKIRMHQMTYLHTCLRHVLNF